MRTAKTLVIAFVAVAPLAAAVRAEDVVVQQIVIERTKIEPEIIRTTTGQRVDFLNRSGRFVHVQFTGDVRQHELVQIPATGPIWVVFHRPGTHPYVVHFYTAELRTLRGVAEVTEDPSHPWQADSCVITVMGACLER
jgi:plastocyanin